MTTTEELLIEIRDTLQALLAAVESGGGRITNNTSGAGDDRHALLLDELHDVLGGLDLPFDAAEVVDHARVHHGLDQALRACSATTTAAVGVLFRRIKGRRFNGRFLERDGREWRLCTSRT